ncbi:MAG: transglycosylase domain-containing protein [Myxococcota bacterium]
MSRSAKLILGIALVPGLLFALLVLGFLTWGYAQFPANTSPPDPSSVPEIVLDGFERHLDAGRDWYAARLFLYRDERALSNSAHNVAGTTAHLWIRAFWSPAERVAEVAHRGYFGHDFVGVESAARGYFGRPAEMLSPEEVAALVLLTRSPISPWCRRETFDKLASRSPGFARWSSSQMLRKLLPAPEGACKPARTR